MHRVLLTAAALGAAMFTFGGLVASIPFWLTPEVESVLVDWRDAGLSCSGPSVGMPGPMVGWGCTGKFRRRTVSAA